MKQKNKIGFLMFFILCIILGNLSFISNASSATINMSTVPQKNSSKKSAQNLIDVNIKTNNKTFKAKFYDNASTAVLLKKMPFTIDMRDFSSQEKVTDLNYTFPKASTMKPKTIKAGELYLWSGNSFVLFYTTFSNSHGGYVPIGYIENVKELSKALGNENIKITFEKAETKK